MPPLFFRVPAFLYSTSDIHEMLGTAITVAGCGLLACQSAVQFERAANVDF